MICSVETIIGNVILATEQDIECLYLCVMVVLYRAL